MAMHDDQAVCFTGLIDFLHDIASHSLRYAGPRASLMGPPKWSAASSP